MKRNIVYILIFALALIITGCEYDNYDEPTSMLTGTVNYNGVPVGVRSGGTQLELWQYGYQLRSKIAVYISQDGTYSARLFDGNYKMVRLSGAPWLTPTDSMDVVVKGNTVFDVPVTPYYTITGETITHSAGVITSSCMVTKIGTLNITNVQLLVGITSILDANYFAQQVTLTSGLGDLSTPKTINLTLTNVAPNFLAARDYVYARLAVRISGVAERYYSPIYKITL